MLVVMRKSINEDIECISRDFVLIPEMPDCMMSGLEESSV